MTDVRKREGKEGGSNPPPPISTDAESDDGSMNLSPILTPVFAPSASPTSVGRRSWRSLPPFELEEAAVRRRPKTEQERELEARRELLWKLMAEYLSEDPEQIKHYIINHIEYTLARSRFDFDDFSAYEATALSVRDRLIEMWNDTQQHIEAKGVKRCYYLSIEYLLGRTLRNTLLNLDLEGPYRQALMDLGYALEDLYDQEQDAALGSGGLGRLAACFLDSLATLNFPAWGYGIRYSYGMFKQGLRNGYQTESPNYWLTRGNAWEIERRDVQYRIRFYGHVVPRVDPDSGRKKMVWEGGEEVIALAYDTPIPGYKTPNTNNLRLWGSKPAPQFEFDLDLFNQGAYYQAIQAKQHSENITSVLYPADHTVEGRELRLKQQYFFVAATLADIVRRFKRTRASFVDLPNYVAVQLNDTHPAIAIPELIRILVDKENISFDRAVDIARRTFSYTNHTLLPEALEKWPVDYMQRLLPRHMQIIFELNWSFLQLVKETHGEDNELLGAVSLIEEGPVKKVRMANLSVVCSHHVNGVAEIHTRIVKESLFPEFMRLFPERFVNRTNGVTPRRWLLAANPFLAEVISRKLGSNAWASDLDRVAELRKYVDDAEFGRSWRHAKLLAKKRLALYLYHKFKLKCDITALFDIHIKRIHEYKRQFLNILSVIHRYWVIKQVPRSDKEQRAAVIPRLVVFAGKAAPAYHVAKLIIKLITSVAEAINNDSTVADLLKVIFIPNYSVSLAEIIIPASDLSQHISTAGAEASGTSNMKFAMNGGLLIGTMDGANIEIAEEIGKENMFVFGHDSKEIAQFRTEQAEGKYAKMPPRLQNVIDVIRLGLFAPADIFEPLLDLLRPENDYYCILRDWDSYLDAQRLVDETFRSRNEWTRKSIMATAGMGKFSSDRSIREYADEIWNIKPCPRPVLQDVSEPEPQLVETVE